MLHTRNAVKAQNCRVRFFPQNNSINSYYVLLQDSVNQVSANRDWTSDVWTDTGSAVLLGWKTPKRTVQFLVARVFSSHRSWYGYMLPTKQYWSWSRPPTQCAGYWEFLNIAFLPV